VRPVEASDTAPENGPDLPDDTITVIICSYTLARWDDLERAVASAQNQTLPAHEVRCV